MPYLVNSRMTPREKLQCNWTAFLSQRQFPSGFLKSKTLQMILTASSFSMNLLWIQQVIQTIHCRMVFFDRRAKYTLDSTDLRQKVFHTFHSSLFGGHYGVKATIHKLQQVFFWPRLP